MKYTGNLKLLKPEGNDPSGWQAFNDNADILDKELGNIKTAKKNWDKAVEGVKFIKDYIIRKSGWIFVNGRYRYTIDTELATKDTIANVNIDIESLGNAEKLYSATDTVDKKIYIYSRSVPNFDLKCDISLFKEVIK